MSLSKPYSVIRIRKNLQNHKNKQKTLFQVFSNSTEFKKSLYSKLNPENSHLTPRTQLMVNSQKMHVPQLMITSGRSHLNARTYSLRDKTETGNKGQTTHLDNHQCTKDSKPVFRVKNVSYLLSTAKSSISPVITQKKNNLQNEHTQSAQMIQQSEEIDPKKINYQSTDLAAIKSIKRLRDEKCLIATSRKLPFSLERIKMKQRFTEKTHFTSTGSDLFDLDISTILDENEPDTPFMRRDSGIESIINIG